MENHIHQATLGKIPKETRLGTKIYKVTYEATEINVWSKLWNIIGRKKSKFSVETVRNALYSDLYEITLDDE